MTKKGASVLSSPLAPALSEADIFLARCTHPPSYCLEHMHKNPHCALMLGYAAYTKCFEPI